MAHSLKFCVYCTSGAHGYCPIQNCQCPMPACQNARTIRGMAERVAKALVKVSG